MKLTRLDRQVLVVALIAFLLFKERLASAVNWVSLVWTAVAPWLGLWLWKKLEKFFE